MSKARGFWIAYETELVPADTNRITVQDVDGLERLIVVSQVLHDHPKRHSCTHTISKNISKSHHLPSTKLPTDDPGDTGSSK